MLYNMHDVDGLTANTKTEQFVPGVFDRKRAVDFERKTNRNIWVERKIIRPFKMGTRPKAINSTLILLRC